MFIGVEEGCHFVRIGRRKRAESLVVLMLPTLMGLGLLMARGCSALVVIRLSKFGLRRDRE